MAVRNAGKDMGKWTLTSGPAMMEIIVKVAQNPKNRGTILTHQDNCPSMSIAGSFLHNSQQMVPAYTSINGKSTVQRK